jgi:hypothetical protein
MNAPPRRIAIALSLAATLGTGCSLAQGLLQPQSNYGATCAAAADCTSGLQCLDTGRTNGRRCVAGPAGPAGSDCLSVYECQAGLLCGLSSGKCERGGLGLPECDSDNDCRGGLVCRASKCGPP